MALERKIISSSNFREFVTQMSQVEDRGYRPVYETFRVTPLSAPLKGEKYSYHIIMEKQENKNERKR